MVRSIYLRMIGSCKTEASRKPVPLDAHVATDLWLWKEASKYSKSEDWIFASPHTKGRYPFWPDVLLLKIIQPAARGTGTTKRIGWHTLRHSYSSLLVANGENVKVVQELMRHASSRFRLDVYSQARKAGEETSSRTSRPSDSSRDLRRSGASNFSGGCPTGRQVVRILKLWVREVGARICYGIDLKK